MSGVAPSVERQLRIRHAEVTKRAATPRVAGTDLGSEYGDLGRLLMAAEFDDAALAALSNAERLAPADARWPYYLGHLRRSAGDLEAAAAAFERTIRLQPSEWAALFWLADTYSDQGRSDLAQPLLEKARQLRPTHAAPLVGLGRLALSAGDFARAATTLEAAIAIDGRPSTAHYHLALAYRGLGQHAKAQSQLAMASKQEIGPDDPLMDELNGVLESAKAYQFRGLRAIDARQWTEAIALFRKGLALDPDSPWLMHGLGTALFQTGDARGALHQFDAAARRSPSFAKAHYSAGLVLAWSGRPADAIDHFFAAVKADRHYSEAFLALADTLRQTGRAADALKHYESVRTIDPRSAEATFGSAMALVQLGRDREARDRLREGMAAHPGRPEFAHALVRLLSASADDTVRDAPQAMSLMPALLQLPRRYEITETMAMVLAENGRPSEAVSWQREAIASAVRAGHHDLAARMQTALHSYESGRPSRTPWRSGELPFLGDP
jgi:tetratricopeptide (TPR) repeat protein